MTNKRKPNTYRRLMNSLDLFDRILWRGAIVGVFGMLAVAATMDPTRHEAAEPILGKGGRAERLAAQRNKPVAVKSKVAEKPAPTVRQMAASIPVAREPATDPGANPVVLIPKEGPNPEIRRLTPAEQAALPPAPTSPEHEAMLVAFAKAEAEADYGEMFRIQKAREAEAMAMICEVKACVRNKEGEQVVVKEAAQATKDRPYGAKN